MSWRNQSERPERATSFATTVTARTTARVATSVACGAFAVLIGGCSSGPGEQAPPVRSEMVGHFQEAQELQAAAITGDMERLNAAGARMQSALDDTHLPARSESHVEDLRVMARAAADASVPREGRRAAAGVGQSCGACHRQFQVGPRITVRGPPPGESLGQHMARQERISHLLWAGLVGPSQQDWAEGATELSNEPPFPREVVARVQDTQLMEGARRELQALGGEAATAANTDARANVLSRVWAVCAGCHQLAGAIGQN